MLTLFKPWRRSSSAPLKEDTIGWAEALQQLLHELDSEKLAIIDHMQEQWECKLAADLFSEQRQKRFAEYRSSNGLMSLQDLADDLVNDMDWQVGQSTEAAASEYDDGLTSLMETEGEMIAHFEECGSTTQTSVEFANALATAADFYTVPETIPDGVSALLHGIAIESDDPDEARRSALLAAKSVADERAAYLIKRLNGKFI